MDPGHKVAETLAVAMLMVAWLLGYCLLPD